MSHCRFIPALQPQCTNPSAHVVLHLAFLSLSKHSSNSSLSPSVPLCIVRGASLCGLGTTSMLKTLHLSLLHGEKAGAQYFVLQSRLVIHIKKKEGS